MTIEVPASDTTVWLYFTPLIVTRPILFFVLEEYPCNQLSTQHHPRRLTVGCNWVVLLRKIISDSNTAHAPTILHTTTRANKQHLLSKYQNRHRGTSVLSQSMPESHIQCNIKKLHSRLYKCKVLAKNWATDDSYLHSGTKPSQNHWFVQKALVVKIEAT